MITDHMFDRLYVGFHISWPFICV